MSEKSFICQAELASNDGKKSKLVLGVLWTGEPQVSVLLRSVSLLKNKFDVLIKIIAFEENYPAHMEVWSFFKKHSSADYRVKLDGDMSINNHAQFINSLQKLSDNSFYIFKVEDFITGRFLNGINVFTKGYFINTSECDSLFPDRLKGTWEHMEYNGISHCQNPSSKQVGEFIGHRFKKSLGTKGWRKRIAYLRLVFFAAKTNLRSIFCWGKIAISSWLSTQYKTSVRESDDNGKDLHTYQENILTSLNENGFSVSSFSQGEVL